MANTVTAIVNEIWSSIVNANLMEDSIAPGLFSRKWQGEAKKGRTVSIAAPEAVTIGTYSPGSDISIQDLTPTNVDLIIDQLKYYAFGVDKVQDLHSKPKLAGMQLIQAGKNLGENIDTALYAYGITNAGLSVDASDAPTAGAGSAGIILVEGTPSSTSEMNPSQVLARASRYMNAAKVPLKGRWAIVDPIFHEYMIRSKIITETAHVGVSSKALLSGKVTRLHGFAIGISSLLPYAASKRRLLFGHKIGMAYAGVLEENEVVKREKQFGVLVKGLYVYGRVATQPNALCDVIIAE